MRPLKVQHKISGTQLSMRNAQENLNMRSFVASVKKQKQNVLEFMKKFWRIFTVPCYKEYYFIN